MKKKLTLKQFVENQEPFTDFIDSAIPDNFNELPRFAQALYKDQYAKMTKLSKTAKGMIYGTYHISVQKGCSGYYRKSVPVFKLTISGNRIYKVGSISIDDLKRLGVEDFLPDVSKNESYTGDLKDFYVKLINANKSLLRAVLTGSVYNEETFVRRVFTLWGGFKLQNWKDGKEFLARRKFFYLLPLLKNHTIDPNKSIRALNRREKKGNTNLLVDFLHSASDCSHE